MRGHWCVGIVGMSIGLRRGLGISCCRDIWCSGKAEDNEGEDEGRVRERKAKSGWMATRNEILDTLKGGRLGKPIGGGVA